jgi:bacteriorhodopsin
MKMNKKIIALLMLLVNSTLLLAQEKEVEMADTMRSNGRIYVVVAVVVTILAGLILYLVRLDRKMTKLEKENRQ